MKETPQSIQETHAQSVISHEPLPFSASSTLREEELRRFTADANDYFADVEPPQLQALHLRHSRVLPTRNDILPLMPKGGVCAEVGTQTGGFARTILTELQPAKLHIFDIDYTLFDHAHFANAIQRGTVDLHEGDSATLLSAFPDLHFDFIYIDADHSYNGIVRDLEQASRKIKEDGWIVCNDYTTFSPLEGTKYGVCRAVNEFCLHRGFEIVYLGLQAWGYHDVALRKRDSMATEASNAAVATSERACPAPVAVTDAPAASEESQVQKLARYVGDDWKNHPYFDDVEQYMDLQWQRHVWPFIEGADFSCVLDLAAGHGRNSEKLKQYVSKIYVVDINQENIDFCRNRFAGDSRFAFVCNDGCSLDAIPAGSISLVYCFDAMVHFDSDVVRAYLREFKRVLRSGGQGFCHHSNFAKNPGGDVHNNTGWRNFMSEALFAHYCAKEGLEVVKSQVIDWDVPESDCLTLFRKP